MLCPEECTCDTGGYKVYCNGTSLNPVPLNHFTDVRTILLSEYNITLLENDSFVSLTELDLLSISKCGLRTIELGAFNRLTELTELYIDSNEITEILQAHLII